MPDTIVEVLGPVTYLVEVDGGHQWKRHADQIKDWLAPALQVRPQVDLNASDGFDSEPFPEVPVTAPEPVDRLVEVEPIEETRTPGSGLSPPTAGSGERRYPTRIRHPADRYR